MIKRIGLALLAVMSATAAMADTLADCSKGRTADALRACSEVIANPAYGPGEKALAYRNRGHARADAGANAQAVADFSASITLLPDAASYAGRGRARLALRDVAGAVADYDAALRLKPETASYYVGRGHARFVQGELTGAIADFTEAIRLDPKSPSTRNRRGLAYRRAGDLGRAIDDYTAAIAINPAYALAYNNRGYVYEAQGRKPEAIADFQAALLFDPSLVGARDGLARLGIPAALLAETEKRVQEGRGLVERNCSGCHAVGARGASPNSKAPEFRNLNERHPGLALREPLTRGLAAPHEEMPRFAPTGEQIDAIIAYINHLSAAKARPAGTDVAPIADPLDIGDAGKGLTYAQRNCAGCHNVLRTASASPNSRAPTFQKIANTPGMTVTALTVWSRTSHPTMPNFIIDPKNVDDLIAYILSLQDRK